MIESKQFREWIDGLTLEQIRPLVAKLVCFAHEAESVRFGDLAPYWDATGEPLVDGQDVWLDETER